MHKYGKIYWVTVSVVLMMYFILVFILMTLCTYVWSRITIPLAVRTNLVFVFVKLPSLSSRWLKIIWFQLYQRDNGIDIVAFHEPRSKELRSNNSLCWFRKLIFCLQYFCKYRCFSTIECYKNSSVQFFSQSLKPLLRYCKDY